MPKIKGYGSWVVEIVKAKAIAEILPIRNTQSVVCPPSSAISPLTSDLCLLAVGMVLL